MNDACAFLLQVSKVLIVTIAYVALGASITWPSPAVSSIEKDNSTLVGTEIVLTAAQKDMTGKLAVYDNGSVPSIFKSDMKISVMCFTPLVVCM